MGFIYVTDKENHRIQVIKALNFLNSKFIFHYVIKRFLLCRFFNLTALLLASLEVMVAGKDNLYVYNQKYV